MKKTIKPAPKKMTRVITREHAAFRLSVCKKTIQNYQTAGILNAVYLNSRVVRYYEDEVEALINNNAVYAQ